MLTKRIIPCLDIKDGKVVKGVNFVGLKDVGDPIELAKKYDVQCADEVVFLDITASYEDRGIMKDIIERGASELTIPLATGPESLFGILNAQKKTQAHGYQCSFHLGLFQSIDFPRGTRSVLVEV